MRAELHFARYADPHGMADRPLPIEWYFLEADKLEVEVHAARELNEAIALAIAAIDDELSVSRADRVAVLRRVREPLSVLPPRVFEILRRGNARQLCASARRYAEGCIMALGEGDAAHELRHVTKWVRGHIRVQPEHDSLSADRVAWEVGVGRRAVHHSRIRPSLQACHPPLTHSRLEVSGAADVCDEFRCGPVENAVTGNNIRHAASLVADVTAALLGRRCSRRTQRGHLAPRWTTSSGRCMRYAPAPAPDLRRTVRRCLGRRVIMGAGTERRSPRTAGC